MSGTALRSITAALWAVTALLVGVLPAHATSELALTFDDLPITPEATESLVATLQANSVPEVYGFFNGASLGDISTPSPLLTATRAWVAAGYPLGNHTYTHTDLNRVTVDAFIQDIAANEIPLRDLSQGMHYHLFRYPLLHEGGTPEKRAAVRAYLRANGYTMAPVSLDFQDWAWTEAHLRCRRSGDTEALSRLDDLFIIHALSRLAHARHQSRHVYGREIRFVALLHATAFQAHILPRLLESLGTAFEEGVRYISTTHALQDPAYREDHGIAREEGATWLDLQELAKYGAVETGPQVPSELGRICRPGLLEQLYRELPVAN